jgi:predicted RNA methylase
MELKVCQAPGELALERQGPLRRAFKAALVNPLANYLPAGFLRGLLKFGKSRLAQANWKDPGGWESMVISYDGQPTQIADKLLVSGGAISMALRNRRKLGACLIAQQIEQAAQSPVHVLCLGAGPGHIIMDAMVQAKGLSHATLVDLSSEAFEYGLSLARRQGLADRVHYIQADIRQVNDYMDNPPQVVKMLGICEYLTDQQVVSVASAAAALMPAGSPIIFNSLTHAHGNDRFFRRVFGLKMIHRSAGALCELMAQAGLGDFEVYTEPLRVYDVIVGRRR